MLKRIIFMGSPEFSIPILAILAENYDVVCVVTQPDRPSGRGQTTASPPVKVLSQQLGLLTLQPEKLMDPEIHSTLVNLKPDLIVLAAYGKLIRQDLLDLPQLGCINVHASLLPRWRGASPIQAAIAAGDTETGITIMKMDAGLDTGAILAQESLSISSQETAFTLTKKLSKLGADLLFRVLPQYGIGKIGPIPQDNRLATQAPLLQKEDGLLDFKSSADELERKVRAYQPWPGAFFYWKGKMIKILSSRIDHSVSLRTMEHAVIDGYPAISTSKSNLVLCEIQPAGKKPMSGKSFVAGARDWVG